MTPSMWRGLARIGAAIPERRAGRRRPRRRARRSAPGIDLRMFSAEGVPGEERNPSASDPGFADSIAGFQAGYTWLRNPAFVSIAAVQGHAIGGGFQLALSCDLRVLADDAKLCMKEPALGLVPDLTGTKPLVDIVGLPRAIELCLTARTVDAQRGRRAQARRAGGARGRAGRRGRATWSPRCCPPTRPRRAPPRRCCRRRRATPWSSRRRPSAPPRPALLQGQAALASAAFALARGSPLAEPG